MGKTLLHYILGGCEPKEKKKFDAVFSKEDSKGKLMELIEKYAKKDESLRRIFDKVGVPLTTDPLGMNSEEYQKIIHDIDLKATDVEFYEELDPQYHDKAATEVAKVYKEFKEFFEKAKDITFSRDTGYLHFKGKEFILIELLKRIGLPDNFYQKHMFKEKIVPIYSIPESRINVINTGLQKYLKDNKNSGLKALKLENPFFGEMQLRVAYEPMAMAEAKVSLKKVLVEVLSIDDSEADYLVSLVF